MVLLKAGGSNRATWRFVALTLACICTLGFARLGYGQVDQFGELINELKYPDPGVRLSAVEELARIGDRRAIDPLIASLSDTDPAVRESAAFGLGDFRNPKAVDPLIVLLKDPDGRVRRAAVRALGLINSPSAVEPLIAVLKDPDPQVRHSAVEALRHMGDRRAIEPLKSDSNDPEFDAQISAESLDAQKIAVPVKVDPPSSPTTNALIYIYELDDTGTYHKLVDGRFLPELSKKTYTFYEVVAPPELVVFTHKGEIIPAHLELDPHGVPGPYCGPQYTNTVYRCTTTYYSHMEPEKDLPDSTLLSVQVQAGRTYYFKFEKGEIKQVDEATGAKEVHGLTLLPPPALPDYPLPEP